MEWWERSAWEAVGLEQGNTGWKMDEVGEKKPIAIGLLGEDSVKKRSERSHSARVRLGFTPTWDPFNLDQRTKGRGGPGLSGKLVTSSPSAMLRMHSGDPTRPDCQRGQVKAAAAPVGVQSAATPTSLLPSCVFSLVFCKAIEEFHFNLILKYGN